MKEQNVRIVLRLAILIAGVCLISGCATPHPKPNPNPPPIDPAVVAGQYAQQVMPSILACEEIDSAPEPVLVKISKFKNTSRFFLDADVLMSKLRLELNRYGNGKIKFLNNNEKVIIDRRYWDAERQEERVRYALKNLGEEIASKPLFNRPGEPVKIAVIPVLNTNLLNMNADSFVAMLRNSIANASQGNIQFLMPGATEGADYWLTGQFILEAMQNKGIINLYDYINIVDKRIREGRSVDITDGVSSETTTSEERHYFESKSTTTTTTIYDKERELRKILEDSKYREKPQENKFLNVMIIRPSDKVSVYENMLLIDKKPTDNISKAKYILSGELSGMTAASGVEVRDYVLISAQLTEPESNEIIWEDAIEIKANTTNPWIYN